MTLELSQLIFGTIQAGYMTRNFDDPRLHDVSSPSFDANVLWNVTPLTSIRATAGRSVEESASTVSAANVRSDVKLEVHHELYRYVLLTGELDYGHFRSTADDSSGSQYAAIVGGRYLVNRRATINGQLRYSKRSADNPFLRYSAAEARLSFRYGL